METKHTPGPWELCDPGDYGDYDGDCRVVLGRHMRLAVVFAGVGTAAEEQNEANARLIAAAPEMAAYIARRAAEGDVEAAEIMEVVHGRG